MTTDMTPADFAAINGNDGFGGGNGAWWLIILLLFWGRGGYGGYGGGEGAANNYVLASDFATLQRQLSDGFGGVEKGLDTIRNGLCDGFYTQAQLMHNLGMNMMQGNNALQAQIASCCCDVREGIAGVNYNLATQANMVDRSIERGFCDSSYRDAMNTNNLMQAGHADADRIIAKLDAMEGARKDERIAELTQANIMWQNKAINESQTAQLLRELGYQCPKPAYVVQPPQQVTFATNCCGQTAYAGGGCGGGTWG